MLPSEDRGFHCFPLIRITVRHLPANGILTPSERTNRNMKLMAAVSSGQAFAWASTVSRNCHPAENR
ncbi:hypothetical protein AB0L49_41850, partial [Streptomyces antimycoticus]|uniref:hypothetical protein n=1 Tax=Streptomyces antimycoticus TaxID=68175 RepID=UPI00343D7B2A